MKGDVLAVLDSSEYLEYQQGYLHLVENEDILQNLLASSFEFQKLLLSIPTEKWLFRYAENKWTVQEVILHIIDTERVFQYRAFCFSREDKSDFPGFDENNYAVSANANERSFESLLQEFKAVRESSISLFTYMDKSKLLFKGSLFGNSISVRAIGYLLSGHLLHHIRILEERYLL